MGEVFTVFLGALLAGTLGLAGANDGGVVLPLQVTQILWINLVTDSGPALAMGIDPEIDDGTAREPRGVNDLAIDAAMWAGIPSTGLVMAVALTTIDLFLPGGLIEGEDTLAVARTASFTAQSRHPAARPARRARGLWAAGAGRPLSVRHARSGLSALGSGFGRDVP